MQRNFKKFIHVSIIIVILVAIVFVGLMIVLNYSENGETNMPFEVSKISILSTVDAQDVEDKTNKWNLQVNVNNDIYIYIKKNEDYKKQETIKTIKIDNIKVIQAPLKGEISFYKQSLNEKAFFENKEEYKIYDLVFEGGKVSNTKNLKIANQGDTISFRCSNSNIGTYISNNEKKIEFAKLLKKINISNDDIKNVICFDLTIELNSRKSYKGTYTLELPIGNVVEEGKTGLDITEFKDTVFKRAQN